MGVDVRQWREVLVHNVARVGLFVCFAVFAVTNGFLPLCS
jgi:hypothetical protein